MTFCSFLFVYVLVVHIYDVFAYYFTLKVKQLTVLNVFMRIITALCATVVCFVVCFKLPERNQVLRKISLVKILIYSAAIYST